MEKAKWIWDSHNAAADSYVRFYDEIEYSGGAVGLSVSCDSNYALYMNGQLAAFGQYADYPHYKAYDFVDLTGFAAHGKNELVFLVWYYGQDSQTYLKGNAGLIYEVRQNGVVSAYSGRHTKCSVARDYVCGLKKLITTQLGFSFRYDTRYMSGGAELHDAVEVGGLTYDLHPRPVKKLELLPLSEANPIDKKKRIYDLGRESVGFIKIKFKAAAGELVTVAFGEHISGGNVNRIIGKRDFSVEFIGSGETVEYLNPFRRLGCRYLQAECKSGCDIEYIGICETPYPVKRGPFKAASPLRQKIYDTSARTLELCMHEHYEDCPWREQALYAMDSRNQMLCGYYVFEDGNYDYARANLVLMSKGRRPDKLLPLCFPAGLDAPIPYFSLIYIIAMREYAEHSGDLSLCRENFRLLGDIIGVFAERVKENGLIPVLPGYWNFYEWSEGLSGATPAAVPVFAEKQEFDAMLNSVFVCALGNYLKIAGEFLKLPVKEEYRALAGKVRQAINKEFFNAENGLYRTRANAEHYSELVNSFAVLCGAADKKKAAVIAKKLVCGGEMTEATLSMISFKYDALLLAAEYEKNGTGYREYILSDIDDKYGYMLKNGATSFWEVIEGASAFGGAGSLCHGWSAIPAYYYKILAQ